MSPTGCPRHAAVRRAALLLALLLVLPAIGSAQQVLRYSGRVEHVDLGDGLVVVDELVAKGLHRRHTIYVATNTPIVTAGRLRPWEMRGGAAFEEIEVSLVDLLTGDFVVVESMQEGGRAIARRITIIEKTPRPARPGRPDPG